ncbi:hypothetical protein UO65_0620 [Actinokineospora spheciospongiae]|uniref:Uncharacterized protein n=1 Tax=Actinokineospora spheciospongiae TaxID=909613 RepID=W7IUS5_9PSEU|nr:hypothetical protein UO65_0620 [Actinokineospora spheciospongiae]
MAIVERAFAELAAANRTPVIDCWEVGIDIADRNLTAGEVVAMLRDRATGQSAHSQLWTETIRRAKADAQPWLLFAVAGSLPKLKWATQRALTLHGGEREDVESTVLVGFIEAVMCCDNTMPRLVRHLAEVAFQRARYGGRPETGGWEGSPADSGSKVRLLPFTSPAGHPDLLLARLVRDGAVTQLEADIIAATRFDGMHPRLVADLLGISLAECHQQRKCGERAIVDVLRSAA